MSVTLRERHSCLGMILCFNKNHHSGVDIICYQEALGEEFLNKIKPNVKAPWNDSLFKIDDDSPLLS